MNRTFLIAMSAAAAIGASAASAQTPVQALPQSGAQPLAKATYTANMTAEFTKIDANKDGSMSKAEIEAWQTASATAAVTARNRAAFAQLDSDKNGSLSQAEFARLSSVPKANAQPILAVLDTNKDGLISRAEHQTGTAARFAALDANSDGSISQAEVEAAVRAQSK